MAEQNPNDPRPDWLVGVQAEGTQIQTIEVDGLQHFFTVVRAGLAPDLPYAVGFSSEEALLISEDVPVEERGFILAHEVREKNRFGNLPEEERCLSSLKVELEDANSQAPDTFGDYILRRKAFFDALIEFYKKPEQAVTKNPEFIVGINSSRDYLAGLNLTF